jgi:spore photoproduct lyase
MTVIFVNYDDIKKQILNAIESFRKKDKESAIWFYASDYSDNLAIDDLTLFTQEFIPFFESLENVKMEIRTKSINIKNILKFDNIKNTEIAFSLNPSEVIKEYELLTSSLDMRISAIHKLLKKNINV